MKRKLLLLLLIFATGQQILVAQTSSATSVKIRGTKLAYPLVAKWADEFKKTHPDINIRISPDSPSDSIDFLIASYPLDETDLKPGQKFNTVSEYVQILVVNSQRPGLSTWQAEGITEDELGNLFFPSTPTLVASKGNAITSYVRDRPVCAVKAFASHYNADAKTISGTTIKGDDLDLTESVKSDVNGISFNNLGFIYDLQTRKVKDSLAVIPVDLNKNGKTDSNEQHYETLDKLITFIEKSRDKAFVISPVNFVYKKNVAVANPAALEFLNWIYSKGQRYSHEAGFLRLPETTVKAENQKLNTLVKN